MRSSVVPHDRVMFKTRGKSRCNPEFEAETDVNKIMERFKKTGRLPLREVMPQYVEAADLPSFMEAQQIIIDAGNAFMSLPAKVRRQFDDNPALFVDFAVDPANVEQMREWGLAAPVKAPEGPMKVEVVNQTPSDKTASAASTVAP